MRYLNAKLILTAIALLTTLATQVVGQDLDKGYAAFNSKDYATALKELKPIAEKGNRFVQYDVGYLYVNGLGVSEDRKEAFKWFKLAAEQGYSPGQWRLAIMYKTGTGVAQNYEEAFKWYKLVAEQGDAYAQNTLGVMFSNGFGVPQDNIKAYLWFTVAGDSGYAFGAKEKDQVSKKMEAEDISTAQEMASKCIQFNYKNCGEY